MLLVKKRITLLSILALLSFSTVIPALAFAAPLANNDKDWQNVNGNSWAWNYSPQTQISKDNVNQLEVKWLFPIGGKSSAPTALRTLQMDDGTTAPPIVRNGIVYVMSVYKNILAIDAKSGKQLWSYQYTLDLDAATKRLPVDISFLRHSHGIRYWEGGDAVLDTGLACDIYGVDSKTGKEKFRINDLCKDVPGNLYKYQAYFFGSRGTAGITTYEKGRQFVYVLSGRIHSNPAQVANGDARHVTMGVSMDAPYNIVWRVFSFPPQDVPTKDWALQECSIGFFRDTPCSEVAAVNQKGLEWDWSMPDKPPIKYAGVTSNWGQAVVDEDTGILYTQTGNQGPYSNMTYAPGPRLYGSTIMAIDMNAGKRIWWLQPFPHDPYDYDCNWSGMLIDNPTLGKVYVKGCKEGIFYVMDAATGKPKYKVDVRDDQLARGQISDLSIKAYAPDPKSYHDMREWNWISYPATKPGEKGEHFTLPANIYPNWSNGVFQTDMSFDPDKQRIILYEGALQTTVLQEYPYERMAELFATRGYPITNATIVARDLETGKVAWTWFYSYSQQRAAMVVSGGMVFTGFTDSTMKFLNKDTGALLRELPLGSPVIVEPVIGKDSDGNSKIFAIVGRSYSFSAGIADKPAVGGTVVAIGLSEKTAGGAAQTTTVTTTQSTTVTATAPAQTTGLPAEITYAAVAVAIIAILGAAVLVMRKK